MKPSPDSKDKPTISNAPSHNQAEIIRQRAHELYEARGREEGHDLDDWLQAEAEIVTGEAHKDSA